MTAAPVAHAGAARSAALGLVSVPTSHKRDADLCALMERVPNAFVPDKVLSRLARLRRAVGFAARGHLVSEKGRRTDQCLMVTLTYAGSRRGTFCSIPKLSESER